MKNIDGKRIVIFLLIAFGYSWLIALGIYLTGGISGSKPIADGSPVTWVIPLLVLYMVGPTLGNLLTRLITKEGWRDMGLRPNLKKGWPYWLIAWFLTPLLVLAGAVVFYLVYPSYFNSDILTTGVIPGVQADPNMPLPPQTMIIVGLVTSLLIAPIGNLLPTLGEELGWRGYLQTKLLPLGERKMYILMGIIWGAWHWPVIWMGYNYPGYPFWGSLAMVWFCFVFGTYLGWASLRAKSVWPAVIGHGALNGIAAFPLFFASGQFNPLLGPTAVGILGSIFFTITIIVIFWKAKEDPQLAQGDPDPQPF